MISLLFSKIWRYVFIFDHVVNFVGFGFIGETRHFVAQSVEPHRSWTMSEKNSADQKLQEGLQMFQARLIREIRFSSVPLFLRFSSKPVSNKGRSWVHRRLILSIQNESLSIWSAFMWPNRQEHKKTGEILMYQIDDITRSDDNLTFLNKRVKFILRFRFSVVLMKNRVYCYCLLFLVHVLVIKNCDASPADAWESGIELLAAAGVTLFLW